jgi:hypothetical protein
MGVRNHTLRVTDSRCGPWLSHNSDQWDLPPVATAAPLCRLHDLDPPDAPLPVDNRLPVHLSILHPLQVGIFFENVYC